MGEKNPSGAHRLRKFHFEQIPISPHIDGGFLCKVRSLECYFCGCCMRTSRGCKYFVEIEGELGQRIDYVMTATFGIYSRQALAFAKAIFPRYL